MAQRIAQCFTMFSVPSAQPIIAEDWIRSPYRPTPTIIEAARTLYRAHSVADINHGFATNLTDTTRALIDSIASARANQTRTICFVTGIPGAGKTLTGLNAANDPQLRPGGETAATFLSGNGPLISIIHESLVRDSIERGATRGEATQQVSTFIHDVHRFLRLHGIERPTESPPENVVIFDEAQRAWNAKRMLQKRDVNRSEADLILDIMERADQWATVIALVGGGQEINDGEAGLEAWGRAIVGRPVSWHVVVSPEVILGGPSVAGHRLFKDGRPANLSVQECSDLHLRSNVRSARAQWLGQWVNQLLAGDAGNAGLAADGEFPVVLTRDLATAKDWAVDMADPNERFGLLASSGAMRLRADGIEVSAGFRSGFPYERWFLSYGQILWTA